MNGRGLKLNKEMDEKLMKDSRKILADLTGRTEEQVSKDLTELKLNTNDDPIKKASMNLTKIIFDFMLLLAKLKHKDIRMHSSILITTVLFPFTAKGKRMLLRSVDESIDDIDQLEDVFNEAFDRTLQSSDKDE